MKRIAALLLLTACNTSSPITTSSEERAVQNAFENWRKAIIAGKADQVFYGMSSAMVSEWLFVLVHNGDDATLRKHRPRLSGQASDDLDVWYVTNKNRNTERPSRLAMSVLGSKWILDLFTAIFELEKARARVEYENIEVSAVYVDSLGATVVARNKVVQASDRYVMVYENGWKVDGHIEPRPQLPK